MAITQAVCNSFKRDVLQEGHQIKTDTLKIALFTSAASLSAGTSVYSTSNEVVSSGGYAPGGGTLTGVTISLGATSRVAKSFRPYLLLRPKPHHQPNPKPFLILMHHAA